MPAKTHVTGVFDDCDEPDTTKKNKILQRY